jgi:hypothetical protein
MKEKERRIGVRVPVDIDGSDRMDGSDRWNIQSSLLCAYVRTYVRTYVLACTTSHDPSDRGRRAADREKIARARARLDHHSFHRIPIMHAGMIMNELSS